MRYYVAKGPIPFLRYDWCISYYKVSYNMKTEVIRVYADDTITKDTIQHINDIYINKYCQEISQEEYEQMLEL